MFAIIISCSAQQSVNIYKKDIAGITLKMPLDEAMLLAWEAVGYDRPSALKDSRDLPEPNKLALILTPSTSGDRYTTYNESDEILTFNLRYDDTRMCVKAVRSSDERQALVYEVSYEIVDKGNVATATDMGKSALKKFGAPSYGQELDGRYYYGWCQDVADHGGCEVNSAFIRISSQELIMQDLALFAEYQQKLNQSRKVKSKF